MYVDMDCSCKGKNLDRMLQAHVLMILYNEPMHGFRLIQELGEKTMFKNSMPDPTGVYRYLKKMEAAGTLRSYWDDAGEGSRPKRIYEITEEGRHCLANWTVALGQYAVDIMELVSEMENTIEK